MRLITYEVHIMNNDNNNINYISPILFVISGFNGIKLVFINRQTVDRIVTLLININLWKNVEEIKSNCE